MYFINEEKGYKIETEYCNLFKKQCNIIIPKGFEKCPKCSGLGIKARSVHYKDGYIFCDVCHLCDGEGYIDWVTKITKKSNFKTYKVLHLNLKCSNNKKCKVPRYIVLNLNKNLKKK